MFASERYLENSAPPFTSRHSRSRLRLPRRSLLPSRRLLKRLSSGQPWNAEPDRRSNFSFSIASEKNQTIEDSPSPSSFRWDSDRRPPYQTDVAASMRSRLVYHMKAPLPSSPLSDYKITGRERTRLPPLASLVPGRPRRSRGMSVLLFIGPTRSESRLPSRPLSLAGKRGR